MQTANHQSCRTLRKLRPPATSLLLSLLLLALPAVAQAQYNFVTNNGALTITEYYGPGGDITIPTNFNGLPVTAIGDYSFSYNPNLISVTLPNGITNIGNEAFIECESLSNVTIPGTVVSIGDYSFDACLGLVSFAVPASVTNLGIEALAFCSALTAINVDTNNQSYSSLAGVLYDKNQHTLIQYPAGAKGSYVISNTVTAIGDYAFSGSSHLLNITIPDSVASIGDDSFYGCLSLTNIGIPDEVTNIGFAAFAECLQLETITVASNDPAYSSSDGVLFDKNHSTLIQCPAGAQGVYAVPDTVGTIEAYAFSDCESLNSLTLPSTVTNIGANAFEDCLQVQAFTVDTNNPSYGSVQGSLFNKSQTALIEFAAASTNNYTVPGTVTNIESYAFADSFNLTSVTLRVGLVCIGDNAFLGCSSLTNISIPNSVISIGAAAFDDCNGLATVSIPGSVTNIGSVPFFGCTGLTSILVDTDNPAYASLDGVLFDKSLNSLLEYPAGKVGNYTVPGAVTNLADLAFEYCPSLNEIYFTGNAPGIESFSFSEDNIAAIFYLPGMAGWGSTFGGIPTALWLPQVQTGDASFGVRTNRFGFDINWTSNQTVVVEASTNLAHPFWTPLLTNTLVGDSFYFSDPQWTNFPARFYRLLSP